MGSRKTLVEILREQDAKKRNSCATAPGRADLSIPVKALRCVPPYTPFPLAALPPIMRDYVDASAAAIGCDPALVALPALAVAASCIGNSCAVRLKRGWIEPSVVWAVTIAPSGQLKSPAYSKVVDPLMEIQMDFVDDYKRERAVYEEEFSRWQDTPRKERGERPAPPEVPSAYVTTDATIESVAKLLNENPRGLLLARDELDGWFQSFVRYKGRGGGTDRPHWLELHRDGMLRIDRVTHKSGPVSVRRACCCVAGTIQPQVLQRALDDDALAAGLGARFLFAMPASRKRRWTEAEVHEELAEGYSSLLNGLLAIQLHDVRQRRPHLHEFTPEAKATWVNWFGRWGEHMEAAEGEHAAALSKLEGYTARLALVHHVVSLIAAGSMTLLPVTDRSLRAAITLVEWFAGEARRVYMILRETNEERECRRLVEWIENRGRAVRARDLHRANGSRWPSAEHAEAALDKLVQAGIGQWSHEAGDAGGRPTRVFSLHS
jgi:hypothetical protein